jgi:hypothetical protein
MTKTPSDLNDAPPPEPGLLQRAWEAAGRVFVFVAAGALLGAIAGHLLSKPAYLSRGYFKVDAPAGTTAAAHLPLTESIIATALSAARQNPAGASLPSSPTDAMDHAKIDFGVNNNVVELSYRASDPHAAACMASELITAYTSALIANATGSKPWVTIMADPVEGRPIRDTSFEIIYGIVGGVIGIATLVALMAFSKMRPQPAE